jgi:dihydropteroate synthase
MPEFEAKRTIRCNGTLVDLSYPLVMGILNVTPDSFYDGGKYVSEEAIQNRIDQIVNEGASIIDVGACSSRPGAIVVTETEELKRLMPVLGMIRKSYPKLIISVDTYRSGVAKSAIRDWNADIINDISAGEFDKQMFDVIAKYNVPYIMMHMKGTPQTMQINPLYYDLIKEMILYFICKINRMKILGICDIIIDPGFGFGKTISNNFKILNRLEEFKIFNLPILIGLSRKSMIYKTLNITANDASNGSTVLNTIALMKGASILRTHDVKESIQLIKLYTNLIKNM